MNWYIQIGGYLLYLPFFIAIIFVPIIITVIVVLIINKKYDKLNKNLDVITQYQKTKLDEILDKEIENTPEATEAYHELIRQIQGYIRHKRFWDPQELLDMHENSLLLLTTVIFEKIKEDVKNNNKNEAVLLCHALDFINCGVSYEGKEMEWIGDEIECTKNHEDMSDNEGRLFKLCLSTVERLWEFVDADLEKIPESISEIDPTLKTYKAFDFETAYDDLSECVDFRNLKPETFDICARGLVYILDDIISELDKQYLPYYQVYYVRALACCLDKQLYDAIVESIEY